MSHRDLLLAAARRCLVEQGYARTSARDLVAESGTNLGSIGYHFGSKDALLDLALAESQAEYTDKVLAVAAPAAGDDTGLHRVRDAWAAMVEAFGEFRPLAVACFEAIAQAERSDDLRATLAGSYAQARRSVAEMLAAHGIGDEADRAVIATFMIAVCDGLMIQWLLDPDAVPAGDRVFDAASSAFAS